MSASSAVTDRVILPPEVKIESVLKMQAISDQARTTDRTTFRRWGFSQGAQFTEVGGIDIRGVLSGPGRGTTLTPAKAMSLSFIHSWLDWNGRDSWVVGAPRCAPTQEDDRSSRSTSSR